MNGWEPVDAIEMKFELDVFEEWNWWNTDYFDLLKERF